MLQKLLSEDLTRRKRAKGEILDARKKGRTIKNDAHMCWANQYRSAFSSIGDDQTIQLMKSYLPDHEFGIDAAHVLKNVWKKSQPQEVESGFLRPWPDFSQVPEEHSKRQNRNGGKSEEFVDDILSVVDDLVQQGTEAHYKHALKLATVAFSMPYVDKGHTIESLLQLPLPAIDIQDLLTSLVLAGETISSDMVLQGIDELLEEAKTKPWMLTEGEGWHLKAWLRLLPFTERPSLMLEVLDRQDCPSLEPWNFSELLFALSYASSPEAENVLCELAKRDEQFLSQSDWLIALAKRNSLSAARILLDLVCNGSPPTNGMEPYSTKILSDFMVFHKQFRQEVYDILPEVPDGPSRFILEHAIAVAADIDGILLLVRVGAAQEKRFQDSFLDTALRHVLVGKAQIESSEMEELYGLPATELRKKLFELVVNGNAAQSRLAAESLTAIDEIRDDYGHVNTDPRHPNITMGVPWPQIDLSGSK